LKKGRQAQPGGKPSLRLMERQADRILPPEERTAFIDAVMSGESGRPVAVFSEPAGESLRQLPPWIAARTESPLKEADYGLDMSSAILGMLQAGVQARPVSILDLCAAPGGKSVLAWRAHQPSVLVGNEIHPKRVPSLVSTYKRLGLGPAWITRLDPSLVAEAFPASFDLVLVDAPCSGQSMIAKGEKALGAFHPQVISRHAQLQRRILALAAECVAPGGALAYTTCTYSADENEDSIMWLLKRRPDFQATDYETAAPRSRLAEVPCFRIHPQDGLGAGGFGALLIKSGEDERGDLTLEALTEAAIRHFPGPLACPDPNGPPHQGESET
jgi:16S rRNA C967 or C1407 C5-methylase (RsmB/RsmF family)